MAILGICGHNIGNPSYHQDTHEKDPLNPFKSNLQKQPRLLLHLYLYLYVYLYLYPLERSRRPGRNSRMSSGQCCLVGQEDMDPA